MLRQFTNALLTALLIGQAILLIAPAKVANAQQPEFGPKIIHTGENDLIFDITVPDLKIEDVTVEGQTFQQVSLHGYSFQDRAGQPQIPQQGFMVGIPADGEVSVEIIDSQLEEINGTFTIFPAPEQVASYDAITGRLDLEAGLQARFTIDRAAYAIDGFAPAEMISVEDSAFVRSQRVARLVVRPLQYNPATGKIRLARNLRIAIHFPQPSRQAVAATETAGDDLFLSSLLNLEQARGWRIRPDSIDKNLQAPAEVFPGDTSRPWFKASLRFSDLYKLTLADLQNPALAPLASAPPAQLKVWKDGQQIPAYWVGDNDAQFEAGEALVFYAQIVPTIYSDSDVYWFSAGAGAGLRMQSVGAAPTGSVTDTWLPASLHLEEDLNHVHDLPYGGVTVNPRWYWHKTSSLFNANQMVYATTPNALTSGYNASLTVRMMGATDVPASTDHHVRVLVNGQAIGDMIWNGKTARQQDFSFPASHLLAGQSVITLQVISDLPGVVLDEAYLDWMTLTYRQQPKARGDRLTFSVEGSELRQFVVGKLTANDVLAFDVSQAAAPKLLNGVQISPDQTSQPETVTSEASRALASSAFRVFLPLTGGEARPTAGVFQARFGRTITGQTTYAVATMSGINRVASLTADTGSNLRASGNRADYLLVYPSEFAAAAATLANHRQQHGLAVAKIDVQDIYDEFSNGRLDPNAIRSFVTHAYENWQAPAPLYLLLLGDGHFDYRMTTGQANRPGMIPPYYTCVDPWLCEVASDNAYVAVSGNDHFPDLAGGRLPANSPQEAALMVNKIINYETAPPAGTWRWNLGFVADNYRDANGAPDLAGNFELLNETLIATLPPQYTIQRLYFDPYPADDNGEPFRYRTPEDTTSAIINRVNNGLLFLNYVGHASNTTWAHEVILRARDDGRNDVQSMTNGGKLPVALDMACLSGNFSDPRYTGIEASMLGWSAGGTVAGWGATGFGVATGHDRLHHGFYQSLFYGQADQLGIATLGGKQELWASGISQDLLDTFGLLGDPALEISLPGQ